jgi:prepilin-type N-terminal cleavage/methylation domain-containing protein
MHVSRARDERGFTVIELLVSMMILGIVVAGAATMMQVVLRQSRGTVERTDAMQRGRLVLDQLTREIRSQVCLNPTTYGLHTASNDSITFYTNFKEDETKTELHRITYDAATDTITRTSWATTPSGPVGYPGTPKKTEVVATKIERAVDASGSELPMFIYNAYDSTASPPTPTDRLTAADLGNADERIRTAKIDIAFKVLPAGKANSKDAFGTQVQDSVFLRSADPNATTPDPTCR